MKNNLKKIGLIMGSISDYEKMKPAIDLCEEMGVSYEAHVYSAHRTPEALNTFLTEGKEHLGVIIAAAGKAAHLAGVIASHTTLHPPWTDWTLCFQRCRCRREYRLQQWQ